MIRMKAKAYQLLSLAVLSSLSCLVLRNVDGGLIDGASQNKNTNRVLGVDAKEKPAVTDEIPAIYGGEVTSRSGGGATITNNKNGNLHMSTAVKTKKGGEEQPDATTPSQQTTYALTDVSIVFQLTGQRLPPRTLTEDESHILEISLFRHLERLLPCWGGYHQEMLVPNCKVKAVRLHPESMQPRVVLENKGTTVNGGSDVSLEMTATLTARVPRDGGKAAGILAQRVADVLTTSRDDDDHLLGLLRARVGVGGLQGAEYFDRVDWVHLIQVLTSTNERIEIKDVSRLNSSSGGGSDNMSQNKRLGGSFLNGMHTIHDPQGPNYFILRDGLVTSMVVSLAVFLIAATVCFLQKTVGGRSRGTSSDKSMSGSSTIASTTSRPLDPIFSPDEAIDEPLPNPSASSGGSSSGLSARRNVRFQGMLDNSSIV